MPADANKPEAKPIPYEDVQSDDFSKKLDIKQWKETSYGGWALLADCPACHAKDAIEAFVPSVIALFQAGQQVDNEVVVCACNEDHGAPAGKSGCGRWGYVTPNITPKDKG